MISIVIGGDVYPGGKNLPYFKEGRAGDIFNDLLEEFEKADLSVINLECPLIEKSTPIVKNGPVLGVESACIKGLKRSHIDVCNLANNHILDHGPEGLKNTLEQCSKAGISTVGAGKNLREARRILIKKVKQVKVGILSVAEHEFSIATRHLGGANPLDVIDFVRTIGAQKKEIDYLIVLLHGGNENYPYPSPRVKNLSRFMVEMGANAVIVQHTHCPGCYEEYQNGHIVYGQGNLIFDWPNSPKIFHEGFLVKLLIAEDLCSTMKIIPFIQSELQPGARRMAEENKRSFLKALKERSLRIEDDSFVEAQWRTFCEERRYEYLSKLLGFGRLSSRLNKNGLIVNNLYSSKVFTRIENIICCEAHRETLETILDSRSG